MNDMELAELRVPGSVLATTARVVEAARDVQVQATALPHLAAAIEKRLQAGIDDVATAFGTAGSLERDANMVFFETAVNFCFWADSPEQKWVVEKDGKRLGGWYSLAACFDRAAANNTPVYDAAFMAELSLERARELFAGAPDSPEIPLLERRVENLREVGKFLLAHYDGQTLGFLEEHKFSAPRIAEAVTRELVSFQDGADYDGQWVWFLKRAQILPSDLSQLTAQYPEFAIKDCDQLTAFADYRLPQVFRYYDVFTYSANLSRRIDELEHLEAGSPEEVEIRAATIQACEQLKAHLPDRTSADIDLGLWLLSQDLRDDPTLRPHHRTLGYFY